MSGCSVISSGVFWVMVWRQCQLTDAIKRMVLLISAWRARLTQCGVNICKVSRVSWWLVTSAMAWDRRALLWYCSPLLLTTLSLNFRGARLVWFSRQLFLWFLLFWTLIASLAMKSSLLTLVLGGNQNGSLSENKTKTKPPDTLLWFFLKCLSMFYRSLVFLETNFMFILQQGRVKLFRYGYGWRICYNFLQFSVKYLNLDLENPCHGWVWNILSNFWLIYLGLCVGAIEFTVCKRSFK